MSRTLQSSRSNHLATLLEQLDPSKARFVFGIDAAASRQPTWDMAAQLSASTRRAATAHGGLEIQLVFYRGQHELSASRWVSDPEALALLMSRVMCAAGHTQIERILKHVDTEDRQNKLAAAVLISDACEEDPSKLYAAARRLNNVPVFMFQEGTDEHAAGVYSRIAALTGGATARFDSGAAERLADLLKAIAAFAAGGRKALANQNTESARLLLSQLKKGE